MPLFLISSVPQVIIMDKKSPEEILAAVGTAGKWAGKTLFNGAKSAGEYIYDHREDIANGAKVAGTATVEAGKSFCQTVYDTASLKIFSKEKVEHLHKRIEEQANEYRQLASNGKHDGMRAVDSIAVGGDLLSDILAHGASPEVQEAFAAAYPQQAANISFEEAVRVTPDDHVLGIVSAVKGKLFEFRYVDYLNDNNLPDGYHAVLAGSATQPGWDIAIHGPDGHVADLLQMKATDSVSYVQEALQKYPDIDVVTTDEVYSQLVMNGAVDQVADSGIANADLTHTVMDAADNATMHIDWTPPIISMALIAFTAYTLDDADAYSKARNFGGRAGKSYLAYLIGGGVAAVTQTWWLGLLAGVGSRYLAAKGKQSRDQYRALSQLVETNDRILSRLNTV
jgi:hypothetical protein